MRYDSLARIMIYRQLLAASWTYLIIDIGNVHDKVDIVSEIIL
jgi:hypothetical protein